MPYTPPRQLPRAIPVDPPDNPPPPQTPAVRETIAAGHRQVDWLTQVTGYSHFRAYIAATLLHRCKMSSDAFTTDECAATGVDFGLPVSLTVGGVTIAFWRLRAGTNTILVIPTQMGSSFLSFMGGAFTWRTFDNNEKCLEWAFQLKSAFATWIAANVPDYHGLVAIGEGTMGPLVDWLYFGVAGSNRVGGDFWKFGSVKAFNEEWHTLNRSWPIFAVQTRRDLFTNYPQSFLDTATRSDLGKANFPSNDFVLGGNIYEKLRATGRGIYVYDPTRTASQNSRGWDAREDAWMRNTDETVTTNLNRDFVRKYLLALYRTLDASALETLSYFSSINTVDTYWNDFIA